MKLQQTIDYFGQVEPPRAARTLSHMLCTLVGWFVGATVQLWMGRNPGPFAFQRHAVASDRGLSCLWLLCAFALVHNVKCLRKSWIGLVICFAIGMLVPLLCAFHIYPMTELDGYAWLG